MKYRIKKIGSDYYPQWKCWFWPFWIYFKEQRHGGGDSRVFEYSEQSARRVINDYILEKAKKPVKIIPFNQ